MSERKKQNSGETSYTKAEHDMNLLAQFPMRNPNPVMRIKLDGTIVFKNDPSDIILNKWVKNINDKLEGEPLNLVRKALTSHEIQKVEIACDETYYALSFAPIPNSDLVNVYGLDITDRHNAENDLRKAMTFNKTLLDTSSDIIYIYDIVEKRNIYINRGIMKILGYSVREVQEMGNQLIAYLMHPDDFQIYLKETYPRYQDLKDGEIIIHEYRMKHKDGSWHWLLSRESVFLREDDGSAKQIFGMVSDVTERRKVTEALSESEQRFRELFETIGSCVAVYEPYKNGEDFIFKDINRAAECQSKIVREEIIGKKVTEIFPSIKEMGLFEVFQKVNETGEKIHHPLVLYKDDRIQQWVENDVYKLPSGEIVAVYEDTSTQRKTEEELRIYREHLEELVKERTAELAESNAELKRMNKLFIGREFRIKELREKVKELEKNLMKNR